MEPPAARHPGSARSTSPPHNHNVDSSESAAEQSGLWAPRRDEAYSDSYRSRRRSERSRSSASSRYTAHEPLSEHTAGSSVGPGIVPQTPPVAAVDRHHVRGGSVHSLGSGLDHNNLLTKQVGNLGQVGVTPPNGPSPHASEPPLAHIPPPPPNFASSRRQYQGLDDTDSDKHPDGRFHRNHQGWRPDSPRVPPPPFSLNPSHVKTAVVIPPPPTGSPPRRSRHGRRVRGDANKAHKHRRTISSSGSSGRSRGSSTFSHSKGQRARSLSPSTDGSVVGVDPVSARNARHFPPRFPAATTRAIPPDKSTAIHNITTWMQDKERTRSLQDRLFMTPEPSLHPLPPARPHTLGTSAGDGGLSYSESESGASGSTEHSIVDTIEYLWQTLKDKRSKVAEVKNEMSQRRRELRDLRRKRDDADNALQTLLRPVLVNPRTFVNISTANLRDRLSEVQKMWNDYNQHEAMYEGLEFVLDEEEETLNRAEIRFFSVLATGRAEAEVAPKPKGNSLVATYPSDVPLELRGISPEGPKEELHPLYVKLTSTVGDLQNAKEQHAEVQAEREAVEEDIAVRKSTERTIPSETINSLEEFQFEEKRLSQRVESLRAQTEKLKHLCEKEGVMRRHMSIGMQYFLDPTLEYEEEIELDDESPRPDPLRHDVFPELLTQPEHVLASPMPLTPQGALTRAKNLPDDDPSKKDKLRIARKEDNISTLLSGRKRQSKSEFVNRWLLQALQTSSLQNDVLYYWSRDDTETPYIEDSDLESEEDGERRKFGGDQYVPTPPISRAESAQPASLSPMSRATQPSNARTLDGSFFLSGARALGHVGHGGQSTDQWSSIASPPLVARVL